MTKSKNTLVKSGGQESNIIRMSKQETTNLFLQNQATKPLRNNLKRLSNYIFVLFYTSYLLCIKYLNNVLLDMFYSIQSYSYVA